MTIGTPRATNYILLADHTFIRAGDTVVLPRGSFVRPIREGLLPAHVKNSLSHAFFDRHTESYCYTRYGIIVIPLAKIKAE